MSHYDGPAFYRKFLRQGAANKIKKAKSLNNEKKNYYDQERRKSRFVSETQHLNFRHFNPTPRSYHIDLQNNPIARITRDFKPRHNYAEDHPVGLYHYSSDGTMIGSQQSTAHRQSLGSELQKSGSDVVMFTKNRDSSSQGSLKSGFEPVTGSSENSNKIRVSSKSALDSSGMNAQSESQTVSDSPKSNSKSKLSNDYRTSVNSGSQFNESQVSESTSSDSQEKPSDSSYSPSNSPLGHNFSLIMSTEGHDITSNLALFNQSSKSSFNARSSSKNQSTPLANGKHHHKIKKRNIRYAKTTHNVSSGSNSDSSQPASLNLQNSPGREWQPDDESHHEVNHRVTSNYHFPDVNLLVAPHHEDDPGLDDWIRKKAQVLNKTLRAFHVDAQVVDWNNGPTVTQFQVKLHLGVKVSKITNLTDDLKLALAAKDIRIEAPIPGKTTCGIEIPNPKPRPVMLSEVVGSKTFKESKSPLSVALGVDLSGHPRVTDIRKMPHGLIAGATGSGKSVFINSLLVSLLYKATPEQLRMILIDPKAVELAPYNRIPHLLSPVISEPKQAAAALKWTVKEMNQRYERLAAAGVRNIEQFNKKAEEHHEPKQKMPYILIVIDELADLMMVASDEVETYIVRITQKARAAGIHLIVATQRPSVDIVTGTIKNNIPTRVAFMVSSQVDSRTIIDTSGAERLLGKGDMLYLGSGSSQPIRLQGTFVSSKEIDRVTDYIRKQEAPQYAFQPGSLLKKVSRLKNQDKLMPRVLRYIANEKTVSTSKLQRVFSIGYNRAAKLIDSLEQHNYISGQQGSKPRDVYLTKDDFKKLNL